MSTRERPRRRWHLCLAWSIVVLTLVAPMLALATVDMSRVAEGVLFLLMATVYALVGALIVARQPGNTIGWLLMTIAAGMSIGVVLEVAIPVEPPIEAPGPGMLTLLILSSVSWMFFIFPIFHLLLTFPTGRLLSPRWKPLVALEIFMVGFLSFVAVFGEVVIGPDDEWTVGNPIGFVPETVVGPIFDGLWGAGLISLTVGGLLAMVLRFRASRGAERQQMKWFLYAVSFFALVYGGGALMEESEESQLFDLLLPVSMIGLALAIGVAVLRYRLYDIDRIISRTVTYAVVVGFLAGVVALVATTVGTRFESPIAVAATTLGVAAVFNPLRRRVQRVVDRRFNRSKYDAERVMDEFARSLRDQVDADEVVVGWVGTVETTMHPSSVGVWVR